MINNKIVIVDMVLAT